MMSFNTLISILRHKHGNWTARRFRQASRENLDAVLGDQKSMLELGGKGTIGRGTSPVIGPCAVSMRSNVDHRFNGKAHAWLGGANSLVLRVVRNIWGGVEELVDTVAAVSLDDTAIAGLGVLLNHSSGVAEEHARLHQLNGLVQTFARSLHHAHRVRVRNSFVSDIVSLVDITVESLVVEGDIDIDDVAVL